MFPKMKSLSSEELSLLIIEEPLLAYFLLRSNIEEDDNYPAYAGISIKEDLISLTLNPKLFATLVTSQKIGLIVHEYLHVLLGHCTFRSINIPSKISKQNVAQDMSINQLILKTGIWQLPPGGVFHNVPPFCYKEGLSAEEYYFLIDRDFSDEEIDEIYGSAAVDYHGDWEFDRAACALIENIIQDYLQKGRQDVGETLLSSNYDIGILQNEISATMGSDDCVTQIKQFTRRIASRKRKFTYKRPSRRWSFPAKGIKLVRRGRLLIIVDTSLSISSSSLARILGIINEVACLLDVDIIMCDNSVRGEVATRFHPQNQMNFLGRGSTNMQPAFDLARQESYRAVVCFTDGNFSKIESGIETLWICINNKFFRPGFGHLYHVNWK